MDDNDFLVSLQNEANDLRNKNTELNTAISTASYQGQEDPNLIQVQLDTGEMLGKIEHFLRGEYIAIDDAGNEYWAKPKKIILRNGKKIKVINTDLILFNNYGVNSIMAIIGNYLDKNTILSFYDEMRINEILADLGDELAKFLYCNYERMGMDTEFKKTRYELTVITILHTVESAYRRALKGNTMGELNSSRIVTQTTGMGGVGQAPMKKKFSLFKPGTW